MVKISRLVATFTAIAILALGIVKASPGTITGTEDDTDGVWLFSAGTDTEPGGQPTDEIVENAINAGILDLIGDEVGEVAAFEAGPPEPYENSRDTTLALVVQGLEDIDDFGLIEEPDDPSSNFDAGIGGWVTLSNFGQIHPDGVVATGTIGPETGVDPEEALGGFEIFIFEDAELSGFICTLTPKIGAPISFTIADRQVNPNTPQGADDTMIAIDLDSLPGFSTDDSIVSIKIQDDSISMTEPVFGDTTLELDAVATRVSVLLGSISGYKWNDLDGDGIKDGGEPGLEDWEINLSGAASDTTTTASDGYYIFTELTAGTYTVSETLQSGWTRTYPPAPGTHTINLAAGETRTNVNFGNKVPLGSISGYKWNDLDGDGVKDAGEPGLGGWIINLSGAASDTTTTASDGYYIFTELAAGTYTVSETLKSGWTRTYPPAPGTHTVNLAAGQNVINKNFGNKAIPPPPPSVGGYGELIVASPVNYVTLLLTISLIGALSYAIVRRMRSNS